MSKADESAFPSKEIEPVTKVEWYHSGLTKRELIAAMAMQGLLAADGVPAGLAIEAAVKCADALLAELAKDRK